MAKRVEALSPLLSNDGPSDWQEIASAKASRLRNSIPVEWVLPSEILAEYPSDVTRLPNECGVLTRREISITMTETSRLVRLLRSMTYSSYEVTLAFCKRAAIAHQVTNCMAEIFFTAALERAKQLDIGYQRTGVPAGPLHGLPISLKDHLRVEGTDATLGFTAAAFDETGPGQESALTKTIRQLGAVLFCKTCVPVALMSGETYNSMSGYVYNPHNRGLSSGGSSGGEAALLVMRGTPLGVGGDIGGSLRIPASFCGLYTLKPSFGRFPTFGDVESFPGQEVVRSVNGPMSNSLESLEIWSRAVVGAQAWVDADPDCLPIPWRPVDLPEQLCFGLVLDDGIVKPLPPVNRALMLLARALELAGHRVIPVNLHEPSLLNPYKKAMYLQEGAQMIRAKLEKTNEPWPRGYESLAKIADSSSPATVSDLWKAQSQRTTYAKQVGVQWAATRSMTSTGREIDALITPCSPWAASKPYKFNYDNYTSLWNLLDYCATTIPVTKVDPELDRPSERYTPRNPVEESIWRDYTPEAYANAPVGVQIVGRRLTEEHLIAVTRVCDDGVHGKAFDLRLGERGSELDNRTWLSSLSTEVPVLSASVTSTSIHGD